MASALLLFAAALQIGNTIRLAAFARRREIGIMRLVGASNLYITLPFLLEAVISAVIGAGLACATLASGVYFVIMRKAEVSIQSLPWIGWYQTGLSHGGGCHRRVSFCLSSPRWSHQEVPESLMPDGLPSVST